MLLIFLLLLLFFFFTYWLERRVKKVLFNTFIANSNQINLINSQFLWNPNTLNRQMKDGPDTSNSTWWMNSPSVLLSSSQHSSRKSFCIRTCFMKPQVTSTNALIMAWECKQTWRKSRDRLDQTHYLTFFIKFKMTVSPYTLPVFGEVFFSS